MASNTETEVSRKARARAKLIASSGGLSQVLSAGGLNGLIDVTMSEALVLGLLKQGVSKYFAIFGHGSTDLGEILRVYCEEGVVCVFNCRNEVSMAHAATALSWQYGEVCAVVTSIGPGALQAMAGSLVASSNGVGVYHIYGDETTWGEGYNMQQIPKAEQSVFGRITALMGQSYVLHTPQAIREALSRGANCVRNPIKAGPFYFLLPLNEQPQTMQINLNTLPNDQVVDPCVTVNDSSFVAAAKLISSTSKIVIKAGGGTRGFDDHVRKLAEVSSAVVVQSPGSTGVLPDLHPQNMHVGGSKGSISGNYAMENAELVIVVGSRAVCQSDCSGIGYPNATRVININGDASDLMHYANTIGLMGDIGAVTERLIEAIETTVVTASEKDLWLSDCLKKKHEWQKFKRSRIEAPARFDEAWGHDVLTQPAAIHIATAFAKSIGAIKLFDAGDVQANGFQIVEDDETGETYTDSGASYMGFAVSALLAGCAADDPKYSVAFTGDGSFMMNPQILIDGVEHGARGMIILFDNRRMAAITGLQVAQYQNEFKTNDSVAVDYVQLASSVYGVFAVFGGTSAEQFKNALSRASEFDGLSLVHVPVSGDRDPNLEMGAYGSWNVGNWVDQVQNAYLRMKV